MAELSTRPLPIRRDRGASIRVPAKTADLQRTGAGEPCASDGGSTVADRSADPPRAALGIVEKVSLLSGLRASPPQATPRKVAPRSTALEPCETSPWMNADEAASYLRCPVSRVRKLTSTRELPCCRDGRRVLYHRDELNGFIRKGGAICP